MFPSVGAVDPTAVIASPCESGTYWRSMAVQARDTFWLKGQPYSLPEMLDYDALAPAFSKTPCINRGSKLKLIIVGMHLWRIGSSRLSTSPGAFFAQLPSQGFPDPDSDGPELLITLSHCGGNALSIFIEAGNPEIGLR